MAVNGGGCLISNLAVDVSCDRSIFGFITMNWGLIHKLNNFVSCCSKKFSKLIDFLLASDVNLSRVSFKASEPLSRSIRIGACVPSPRYAIEPEKYLAHFTILLPRCGVPRNAIPAVQLTI
jgi:hypothetical protein